MDGSNKTPQKLSASSIWAQLCPQSSCVGGSSYTCGGVCTPAGQRKPLHPRSPNRSAGAGGRVLATAISSASYYISPPAKRYQRIRNPFEAAIAEKLHLPLIASPSLFQRPATPQMSSTQFEWTIDEVSSLNPAHVEAHETQFQDSPDSEYEAKVQSAISSFFKEQQIVPSPVDCPLRHQRIRLSELNGDTPINKAGRRIRDWGIQTELTLPPQLPPELEAALCPYFQPHLAGGESCRRASAARLASEAKDMSMRRKLFDKHSIVILDHERAKQSPERNARDAAGAANSSPHQFPAVVGKLSDSLDKSSFGSLSPISGRHGLSLSPRSPLGGGTRHRSRLQDIVQSMADMEQISPIQALPRVARAKIKPQREEEEECRRQDYRCEAASFSSDHTFGDLSVVGGNRSSNFTPDRSSSPFRPGAAIVVDEAASFSTDSSFNIRISRLAVKDQSARGKAATEVDLFTAQDDADEVLDVEEEEEMHASQLSLQSLNCSSSNSDTPRSKRRSANRKNLSQSFSTNNWLDEEEDEDGPREVPPVEAPKAEDAKNGRSTEGPRAAFDLTDSGYNEKTTNSSSLTAALAKPKDRPEEGEVVCCSTPLRL